MVAQNLTKFVWNKARTDAAALLAEDVLTDAQIAQQVGVSRRQLAIWKHAPEFQAKIQEELARLEAEALRYPIARRRKRVAALQRRWDGMQRVIDERATDPVMQDVPGGQTGLMVRQLKSIGFGENNQTVEEFVVDVGLMREMRAHEEQAAKECGQWPADKGDGGEGVAVKVYVAVDVELV